MKFLTRRLLRRFGPLGRLADMVMVGGWLLRFAQRRGLIDDAALARFGLGGLTGSTTPSGADAALAGGAALRLFKRLLSARRARRLL